MKHKELLTKLIRIWYQKLEMKINFTPTLIIMRLANSDDESVIKKLLPDSLGGFSDILPTLDTGEALIVGDACLLPSRIRVDEPVNKPNSGTVNFWDEWQEATPVNR